MSENDKWDEPSTDVERAAAEALARALEGNEPAAVGVDAEVETASLLRASGGSASAWSDDRAARVWARVAEGAAQAGAGAEAGARAPERWRRRWRWGAVGATAATAAALAVIVIFGAGPTDRTPLPAPSIALLKAQTIVAARRQSLTPLADEMRRYRASMYAALTSKYREAK